MKANHFINSKQYIKAVAVFQGLSSTLSLQCLEKMPTESHPTLHSDTLIPQYASVLCNYIYFNTEISISENKMVKINFKQIWIFLKKM